MIDWTTVIFQIINFLVLVFLLRKYLYGPIIHVMDAREQKIVQREEEAAAIARQSDEEAKAYRQKLAELQDQEGELLDEARAKAEREGLKLLEEARSQVDNTRQRWGREMERERETFLKELRYQVSHQACLMAQKCLKDLADAELERMIWDVFHKKLQDLPERDRASLREALKGDRRVTLSTSFEPLKEQLQETAAALKKLLGEEAEMAHETNPDLICGVELVVGSFRTAWSVAEYMKDVEAEIIKHLNQAKKEAQPDVQTQ